MLLASIRLLFFFVVHRRLESLLPRVCGYCYYFCQQVIGWMDIVLYLMSWLFSLSHAYVRVDFSIS